MNNLRKACLKFAGLSALAVAAVVLPPVLTSAQNARAQQPSPNGKILFQSTQGSDTHVNEIYTMDADGKRQVRLTYNEFDDAVPVWSPSGDRIAFLTDRGAGYDIYLINPDGTGERPLRDADHGGPLTTDNIRWSPDGTKIMYSVGGRINVVEVTLPGGEYSTAPVENLSASVPAGTGDYDAVWSPDGSKILFRSTACDFCVLDLFTVNADGTGRTQLTNTPEAEFAPSWSPDGAYIAYGSYRGGFPNAYVMNADGTGDHVLTAAVSEAGSPTWSPDGTRLAFYSAGPSGAPRRGLYVVKADGTGLTFLTDEASDGSGLLWSPDGTTIVTQSSNNINSYDVISVDVNGARHHVTNLTKTRKADEFAHSWQRLPTP